MNTNSTPRALAKRLTIEETLTEIDRRIEATITDSRLVGCTLSIAGQRVRDELRDLRNTIIGIDR